MKFKAWDGTQWRTNFVMDAEGNVYKISLDGYVDTVGDDIQDWKVVRSTDIIDIHGKEVYEFDIINCCEIEDIQPDEGIIWSKEQRDIVIFDNDQHMFRRKSTIYVPLILHETIEDIEVIGNVYANHLLLEDK